MLLPGYGLSSDSARTVPPPRSHWYSNKGAEEDVFDRGRFNSEVPASNKRLRPSVGPVVVIAGITGESK